MTNEEMEFEFDEENIEAGESHSVWSMLTPEQRKYFLKLNEKNEDNLRYIGWTFLL